MTTTSLQIDTHAHAETETPPPSSASSSLAIAIAITSPAFESTVVSYASRILKTKSPSTAVIDSSVAPYVTSILRSALSNLSSKDLTHLVSNLSFDIYGVVGEYDALMELLMEQCDMGLNDARSALQSIARVIQTGKFENDNFDFDFSGNGNGNGNGSESSIRHRSFSSLVGNGTLMSRGKFRSKSMGAEYDHYGEEDAMRWMGDIGRKRGSGMNTMDTMTLPSWSVAKRQDSPNVVVGSGHGRGIIEEEPSFYLEEDEAPSPSPNTNTNTPAKSVMDFMMGRSDFAFSPFLTDEEKRVAEELKNLPAPTFSFTPLKQDQLIPVDLLGAIDDPSTPLGDMIRHQGCVDDEDSTLISVQQSAAAEETMTPMKGADSTTGRTPMKGADFINSFALATSSSPLAAIPPHRPPQDPVATPQAKNSNGKGKNKGRPKKDNDLAAALFSRPRARSMHSLYSNGEEKSPKLKPMAPPSASQMGMSGLKSCSAAALMNNSIPALFQKQLDSAEEILLAMNYDVCRDAAHEAALVSNADVNVAQHVIDGALAAPPVCRHMLNDGCYRSDCQFSHDMDGHTCLFWLRGRCGKGDNCRFMHGFSEKLLDGVNVDFLNVKREMIEESTFVLPPAHATSSKPIAVKTGNLVQHNLQRAFSQTNSFESRGFSGSSRVSFCAGESLAGSGSGSGGGSIADTATLGSSHQSTPPLSNSPALRSSPLMKPISTSSSSTDPTPGEANSGAPTTFSFASIASKGYSKQSSFNKGSTPPAGPGGLGNALNNESAKTVRIPQNLWTSTHNRSSGAFHIADPIARYKEVSTSVQRNDVVDLHFQSVKTFPIVLSTILPEKLRNHGEVWIVTGSGHHVSKSSHQKGGGVLETAVLGWLGSNDYSFTKGKDKNGFSGAVLVHGR